jgi:SAM-dependent methyltransferase
VAVNERWFEDVYATAGDHLDAIPWADLAPHPALIAWLDRLPEAEGGEALVVGCGLGDDAEALSDRGYRVTAFDIAPTAIAQCQRRFPRSEVDYLVADLLALPEDWKRKFDLVVEIRTLQSLPPEQRTEAARAVAAMVRPGGRLWVRCFGRDDDEAVFARPWPVSRRDLRAFVDAGLHEIEFHDEPSTIDRGRAFTAVYGLAGGEPT